MKVGDKVRVLDDTHAKYDTWRPRKGDVGVVTYLFDELVTARFDQCKHPTNGHDDGWIFRPHEVELVNTEAVEPAEPLDTVTFDGAVEFNERNGDTYVGEDNLTEYINRTFGEGDHVCITIERRKG